MTERARKPRGLRARLMWALGLYALALVTLYTLYALAFAYTVEDQYIERGLREEAARLRVAHDRDGRWPAPQDPHLRLFASPAEFPAEVRRTFAAEPQRREYSGGDGRHYHLHAFEHAGQRWYLLAEVSGQLVFRRMRATVIEILGWSALAALALGLLLATWVARSTSQRLVALADQVRALDAHALPRRLPDLALRAGDAEIEVLRQGLNDLLHRVAGSLEREQGFTRDASHELRTPLAVIMTSAEQLARTEDTPTARQAALARLQTAATQLAQTLDALLELARQEPAFAATGTPLLPAIERAIVEQAARRPREDLDIGIDVAAQLRVLLRPALLRIVLANLIGNVFAHAGAGPVAISVSAGRCRITNRPADVAHRSAEAAGLGLGLSILRRLDEHYGLDLRIEVQPAQVIASFACQPGADALAERPDATDPR